MSVWVEKVTVLLPNIAIYAAFAYIGRMGSSALQRFAEEQEMLAAALDWWLVDATSIWEVCAAASPGERLV